MKTSGKFAAAVAAGAMVAASTIGLASAASAATTTSAGAVRDMTTEKARCTAGVDARLAQLARLNTAVTAAKHITAGHKSTESAAIADATTGLQALKTKIAGDADAATLKTDCESMVTTYRVFVLRTPQAHLVIADDAESFAIGRLGEAVPKLSDAIDKATAAGKDTTAAKAALADVSAKLADATSHAKGVSDAVIVLTPADYNANHAVLAGPRDNVRTAAADIKAAAADVKTITAALKS